MSALGDSGRHLLRTAELAFDTIEDPEEAVETAVALFRLVVGHVPPEQRLKAGCELVSRALL